MLSRTAAAPFPKRRSAVSRFNESSCCHARQSFTSSHRISCSARSRFTGSSCCHAPQPPPFCPPIPIHRQSSASPVVVAHSPLLSASRIPVPAWSTSCCPALWAPPPLREDRKSQPQVETRRDLKGDRGHRRAVQLLSRTVVTSVSESRRRRFSHVSTGGPVTESGRGRPKGTLVDPLVRPGFGAGGHYSQWPPPLAGRLALVCPGEIAPALPRVRTTGSTQRASSFTVEANRVR